MLKSEFPMISVVNGTGQLFWGGGMRKAWSLARSKGEFDFYLWLNDDTYLLPNSLVNLFEEYRKVGEKALIVGACTHPSTKEFSYGGHGEPNPIPPSGIPQKVKFINGNLVLIPKEIEQKVGSISATYTHYLGDYDYALRVQEAGFNCYTSSHYLAECETNELPNWADPKLSLAKRWNLAHHTKGLALKEYIKFKSYHSGILVAFKSWLDVYLKILNPQAYVSFRNFILKKNKVHSN